jgi:PAS domain S-box-containing protein
MKWTISRKFGLAFGLAILAFGSIGAAMYSAASALQRTAGLLGDGCRIRDGLDALALELRTLEARSRPHTASGEQRPLELKSTQDAFDASLAGLRAAARGNPDREARVANLQTLAAKYLASLRNPASSGRLAFEQIERAVAETRRYEAGLLLQLERQLASGSDSFIALILGTVAALLGVALLGFYITVKNSRAVRGIIEGAREIEAGTSCQVRAETSDELADLAAAVTAVAEKLLRAEEHARHDSRCLEAVLGTIGDGVIVSTAGGRVALSNAAAAAILGANSEGAVLSNWPGRYGFYAPDTRAPFIGELPQNVALRGEIPEDVELYVTSPESAAGKWLNMRARPLFDGAKRPFGVVTVLRDVTEQKRAENALRENEEKFRSFVETTNEWIWSIDCQGNLTYSNPAAIAILGYEPDALIGRPIESLVHDEDRHRFGYRLRQCVGQKRCWAGVVLRWNQSNGSSRYTESNAVPILGPEGQVTGMRGADRDITERRATEMHIEHLNHQLEQRVAQLNAANKELEAFSYSVSHDLRAPLRSIDGFSQALIEDYGDQLDGVARDYLQRVRAASQRMAHLIDDLLQLSRVARNELSHQQVDLTALAQTVAAELAARQQNRAVEFVVAPGLTAYADPQLLRIVMENLLNNACKFTRDNPNAKVEVGAAEYKGDRAFFVRDNGVGFDMTYAGKLFGAFQRLHAATEFEGTGIGLATVQRIINRHGGHIAAEAAVGQGATFYFTLS